MAKRIEIDGKVFRMRRGELVEIPERWVGVMPTKLSIRERPSKMTGKLARIVKLGKNPYADRKDMPLLETRDLHLEAMRGQSKMTVEESARAL